jgi:hypothetical protein
MSFDPDSGSCSSSMRFIYLDETAIQSIKNSHHTSNSTSKSLEWCSSSPNQHPQSPCSESSFPQHNHGLHCQDSSASLSTGRRKSLGRSLAKALISPVRRVTKEKMVNGGSPKRIGESLKQAWGNNPLFHSRRETWQEELNLPRNTTEEQAIAILLSRELDELDF